jgi:putative nucleotidyltransferase with HDIG domain
MKLPPDHTSSRMTSFFTRRPWRNDVAVKIFIGSAVIILIVLMFPHPESTEYSNNIGTVWTDNDLVAPFSFPVYRDLHQYEKECQEAVRNVYDVFERNDTMPGATLKNVKSAVAFLRKAASAREQVFLSGLHDDSLILQQVVSQSPFHLTDGEWDIILKMEAAGKKDGKSFEQFENSIIGTMNDLYRVGIIDQIKRKQSNAQFALRKGTAEDIIPYAKIYDEDEAANVFASRIGPMLSDDAGTALALKITRTALRPNIIFDQHATSVATQIAEDNVPRTIGFVQENERIVSKHDRITEEIKLKLDSFRKAKAERGSEFAEWKHWIGIFLHVCIILSLYTIYIFLFRKRIFHDNGKLTLVALLLLLETMFAYISLAVNVVEPVQYLIFVPAASMLLTIIFDSRIAFYGTVTIALLVAGIRGNDYGIALISLVAGALGAYTVRDIKNRTQIFRSLIFIFLGYSVSIIALSLEQFDGFRTISTSLVFALANAIFSPVLTYGLLIFFERVLNVTTDLTLLELSDFNQPLLKQLSEKAPGTFHHSITIGNLAEAAAEAVGANSILARVGGYYHDIGKMLKPEYFVENQVGTQSRHGRLKPRMSALIIQSHVKEGVELGKEHRLPGKILDFIPQHHGTTRISFFYDKALKQAAKRPTKDTIHEEDFQYPGPKPQTRETAIVMLADSVEASTRSFEEVTPQQLETAIEEMIKQRFAEGQLDECELTLRDLTKIKDAFLNILLGIHHQRIKYPEQLEEERTITVMEQAAVVPVVGTVSTTQPPREESPVHSTVTEHGVIPESQPTSNDGNGQANTQPPLSDQAL